MSPDVEYIAVPNAAGGHLYFPASTVMQAVNKEWERMVERVFDSSSTPHKAAKRILKMRTPQVTARVLANAYASLIESGEGVSREQALELASSVLDPRSFSDGKTSSGKSDS